jgi:hypothetical protein
MNWRSAALLALSTIFSALSMQPSIRSMHRLWPRIMQSLEQRGLLHDLCNDLLRNASSSTSDSLDLFLAQLQVFTQLSEVPSATQTLQNLQLFSRICSLDCFEALSALRDHLITFSGENGDRRAEQLVQCMSATLQLIFSLHSLNPASTDQLTACLMFLKSNKSAVNHLLRLRELSIQGLKTTDNLLCLLVAGLQGSGVAKNRLRGVDGIRDIDFVPEVQSVMSDCNGLLRMLGKHLASIYYIHEYYFLILV